jgi:hypothetical protein
MQSNGRNDAWVTGCEVGNDGILGSFGPLSEILKRIGLCLARNSTAKDSIIVRIYL